MIFGAAIIIDAINKAKIEFQNHENDNKLIEQTKERVNHERQHIVKPHTSHSRNKERLQIS